MSYALTPIEELMRVDPLAEAEKLTGRSYKEDGGVAALGMLISRRHQDILAAELLLNRDTNAYEQTADQFLEVVKDLGFEQVLELHFETRFRPEDEPQADRFLVFHRRGILLKLDTYCGNRINSSAILLNWTPKEPDGSHWYPALENCSHGATYMEDGSAPLLDVSFDCRQGLRDKLGQLEKHGTIPEKWQKVPFMWLLHHGDTRDSYVYQDINRERIAMLPDHVREMIGKFE